MPKRTIKKQPSSSNGDFLDFLNAQFGGPDSDHDGIVDKVEKLIGTDPRNPDTDGDGLNDGEEIRHGRNPLGPGTFRDFWLAHQGNNFRPTALHPKRVLLYTTSAALIKILAVVFALSVPLTAWLSTDTWRSQAQAIINLTNELRANQSVGRLTANTKLTEAAYAKADDELTSQYFAHTSPTGKGLADWLKQVDYHYLVAGENLAMGFTNAPDIMKAWEASPTHYANLVDPDFNQIGVGAAIGLFQGQDTIMVAQMFGRQPTLTVQDIKGQSSLPSAPTVNHAKEKPKPAVLSAVVTPPPTGSPGALASRLTIDQSQSKVSLLQATSGELLLQAEIFLSSSVVRAGVSAGGLYLPLTADSGQPGRWFGKLVITDQNITPAHIVAVPATVTAFGVQDDQASFDLSVSANYRESWFSRYQVLRLLATGATKALFTVSNLYFGLLALMFAVVLTLALVAGGQRRWSLVGWSLGLTLFFLLCIMI